MCNSHSMLVYSFSNHRQVTDQQGLPANIIFNLPTQVLQDRHRLVTDGSTCGVCLQGFQARQCIRTLPCQHPFHISCIDNWLTNHSQCPVEGSYVGSVIAATATNGRYREVPGIGHLSSGVIGNHGLGGAGNKKSGQRLKALTDKNDSAKSLPSSFTLSGSGLLATNSNKTRWVRLVFSRIKDSSVRFLNVITRGGNKDFIGLGMPVDLFEFALVQEPKQLVDSLAVISVLVQTYPKCTYLYWTLLWMGPVSVVTCIIRVWGTLKASDSVKQKYGKENWCHRGLEPLQGLVTTVDSYRVAIYVFWGWEKIGG